MLKQTQKGFTLIELMIVIAIIGILAAVAVPQYGQYTKRAKFADVVSQATQLKTVVSLCIQDENDIAPCDGGFGDIPANVTSDGNGQVESIDIENATITLTGKTAVSDAIYKLEPDFDSTLNTLTWSVEDQAAKSCKTLNLCK